MNIINQFPFLETSRKFPNNELSELAFQTNLAYVDIANGVNNRIISLFPITRPAITGERWFLSTSAPQSTIRQVYTFTSTSNIPHNIDTANLFAFSRMWGTYTDGTNFYGLIAGSNIAIAGQISFYVTNANIVFEVGAGAPSITSGVIVLEWISLP